jgi:hypothetical protein
MTRGTIDAVDARGASSFAVSNNTAVSSDDVADIAPRARDAIVRVRVAQ